MSGFASLEQLRNSPAGTVFKERRGGGGITHMDGWPISNANAEYRSAHHARSFRARVEAIERQSRELLEG